MRIAQVTQHYLPVVGGQEVYIEHLNRVFHESKWQVEILQPSRGASRDDVVLVPRIRGLGKLIHGSEPYVFNFLLPLLQGRKLAAADVIISHYAFHAAALRKYARKTIVLSHGIEWHLENQTWDDRIHERRARACLDAFPHVVNDTHYLRHFGYDIEPASGFFTEVAPRKWFIPNCVDTDHFDRTSGIAEIKSRNVILVPRQITEDRGIDLAIAAFKHFRERNPDTTMLIVGKRHPGGYYQACVDLIKRLELENCVVFQDHIPHGAIVDYYSSSLMTVIPTLRREGTSLSALESMSCGTPTVSTNVAGLRDLPTVQADANPEALAHAMDETFRDAEATGRRQREKVRDVFNFANWATAWRTTMEAVANSQSH